MDLFNSCVSSTIDIYDIHIDNQLKCYILKSIIDNRYMIYSYL